MISSWLKSAIRRAGFDLVRRSDDPVLQEMLTIYRELRMAPGRALQWEDRLPQPASWAHLRNLLREQAIDLVLDIGANTGQFAGLVRRLGYAGDIVSFEPLSSARTVLQAAAAGDPQWTVRPEALGRERGQATLAIYADSSFSSLHTVSAFGRQRFGELDNLAGRETVEVATLDSLYPQLAPRGSHRIFLKTDTQGHDLEVLAGATETLKSTAAVLSEASTMPIYENAPRLGEVIQTLERAGFAPSGLFPISHQQPPSLALVELDCYFVRSAPANP